MIGDRHKVQAALAEACRALTEAYIRSGGDTRIRELRNQVETLALKQRRGD